MLGRPKRDPLNINKKVQIERKIGKSIGNIFVADTHGHRTRQRRDFRIFTATTTHKYLVKVLRAEGNKRRKGRQTGRKEMRVVSI